MTDEVAGERPLLLEVHARLVGIAAIYPCAIRDNSSGISDCTSGITRQRL